MKSIIAILCFSLVAVADDGHDHKKHSAKKDSKSHNHEKMHDHKHGEDHSHKDTTASVKAAGKDKLLIKVHGMVCPFCAQGIEARFKKLKPVKDVKVDMDKMEVTVMLKTGMTLTESLIKENVEASGFTYKGSKSE